MLETIMAILDTLGKLLCFSSGRPSAEKLTMMHRFDYKSKFNESNVNRAH